MPSDRALRLCIAATSLCIATTAACAPGPAEHEVLFKPVAGPACSADDDGVVTKAELPFVIGATARMRIGTHVAVDVEGAPGRGSARVWDLTRLAPDDEPSALTLEDIDGQWFARDFPSADVAGPLAPGNALLGPLALDDDGVKLLGSASSEEHPSTGETLLVYRDPVTLYPLPLELGAHASTETQAIDGVVDGIPFAVDDTYTVDVSAHGEVILPDLIAENAVRVTIRLERVPVAGQAVQQVTHVFVTECLGEVARFVSPFVPLEQTLDDDFPVADQVWRLSF